MIKNNSTVLFQGDSVTDCGRSREDDNILGNGYANFISAWYSAAYPEKRVKFINRGVSGDRAINLVERWNEDCIHLKPDLVSILIGINDCWRRYDNDDPTSAKDFEDNYRKILTDTKEKLDAKIILCEPFVLPYPEDRKQWREDLDPKIHAIRDLAREFNAIYVPFDGAFASACTRREPAFWAEDGVHPTQEGHAFLAKTWLESIGQ